MCNDNDAIEIRNRNVTIHDIHTNTHTNVFKQRKTQYTNPCLRPVQLTLRLTLTLLTIQLLQLQPSYTILHTHTYINVAIASINQSIHQQRDRYRLRVTAADRGTPPSAADVDVELDVVDRNNKPPIWDKSIYGPIHIRENVTVGTIVTSVKARFV